MGRNERKRGSPGETKVERLVAELVVAVSVEVGRLLRRGHGIPDLGLIGVAAAKVEVSPRIDDRL
jgi:hypothetical protein